MELVCTKCGALATNIATGRFSIMRHGRTKLNEESRTVGSIDEPMSEKGFIQAESAAEMLTKKKQKMDFIVSSPMVRAMQTATIISKKLDVAIIADDRLREIKAGVLEWQLETPGSDVRLLEYDFRPEGATPLEVFEKETKVFLDDFCRKYRNDNVLLVTHRFRMLTIIKLIHGWNVQQIKAYNPPGNCEIVAFAVGANCKNCGNIIFKERAAR